MKRQWLIAALFLLVICGLSANGLSKSDTRSKDRQESAGNVQERANDGRQDAAEKGRQPENEKRPSMKQAPVPEVEASSGPGEAEESDIVFSQPDEAIHLDLVTLNGHSYEIRYANDGEFDYTSLVIAEGGHIWFDSRQAGIEIEAGIGQENAPWVQTSVMNESGLFLFSLGDNRPDPASLVVEISGQQCAVTVYDDVEVKFEDVDGDGVNNVLAFSSYGQMPLGPALAAVYKWNGEQYVADRESIERYWEKELEERTAAYQAAPDVYTLDGLLSAYLVLGRKDEAREQFALWYEWAGQEDGEQGFVSDYEAMLDDPAVLRDAVYSRWMERVKPLGRTGFV